MTHPLIEAYRLAVLRGRTTEPDIAAYEIAEADLARALTRTPDAVRALREAYLVASCATPHQWTPEGMRMHIVIGIRKLIEAAEAPPQAQDTPLLRAEEALKRQDGIKPNIDALAADLVAAGESEYAQAQDTPAVPVEGMVPPKFYPIGPNTCGGYQSRGDGGEFSIPDYMHPELGPDKTPFGQPSKLTLWFKSWDDAQAMLAFLNASLPSTESKP